MLELKGLSQVVDTKEDAGTCGLTENGQARHIQGRCAPESKHRD